MSPQGPLQVEWDEREYANKDMGFKEREGFSFEPCSLSPWEGMFVKVG